MLQPALPAAAPGRGRQLHASTERLGTPSAPWSACLMMLPMACERQGSGARRRVSRSDKASGRAGSSRARRHTCPARPSAGLIGAEREMAAGRRGQVGHESRHGQEDPLGRKVKGA